jgi:hypothetical protein
MTTKGTEYFDGKRMTLLTDQKYKPVHNVIGDLHRWLEMHSELFGENRINIAPVGLLFPEEKLWLEWNRLAPIYFGVCQILTAEGIPWRVIRHNEPKDGLEFIIVVDRANLEREQFSADVRILVLTELHYWELQPDSFVSRQRWLIGILAIFVKVLLKAYRERKLARQVLDRLSLQKLVTQSPYYNLPKREMRSELMRSLPNPIYPRVIAKQPVLIEIWRDGGVIQVHLVNYSEFQQKIRVEFGKPVSGRTISPAEEVEQIHGKNIEFQLDVYKILELT